MNTPRSLKPTSAWEPAELQAAIDTAADMIFMTDDTPVAAGGPLITYVNGAMAAEFGYRARDIVGRAPDFAFGPRTDRTILERIRTAMASMSDAQGEIRVYRADGTTFWSDWRGHGMVDRVTGRKRWIAIGRNTDQRRQQEEELAMLSTAIEHADDAVFVYSICAGEELPRVRYVNAAGVKHSGFSQEELSTTARRLGPLSGETVVTEVVSAMRAGKPLRKRMRLYRKDGTTYWANRSFQPIRDRLGDYSQWVCIERDVSGIVEREEERSDLLAMIGHDLRNPLSSILGFSELLLEDMAVTDPNYDAVRQIRISARRLESLAAEMLLMPLIERDEYHPHPEPVDLAALVDDVLSYFIDRERIDTIVEAPVCASVDPAGIRHVIENLLSNAVKFSASTSRVTVTLATLDGPPTGVPTDRAVSLCVRDRGIGIPAEDLPNIFERASRARNVGSRNGTGLGLSFAKRLIERNAGTITAKSTEGQGTEFHVTLPAVTLSEGSQSEPQSKGRNV